MKLLFFWLFSISIFNFGSQSTTKLTVPEVKEGKIIDSALDVTLPKSFQRNCCILLELKRFGYVYSLYIDLVKTNLLTINLYKHDLKNNLRFFRYKGYLIFVTGPNDPYNFFSNNLKTTYFYFENSINVRRGNDTDAKNENYLEMYNYQNGRFETILKPLR